MADETTKPGVTEQGAAIEAPETASAIPAAPEDERASERVDRSIADFVRRAVSAGVGVAARSKDDIVRVAATEMRGWLDHLNLNEEIAKALSKMVIEVKTEIRFRPGDDGKLIPETTNDVKLKGPGAGG
jgi:hypothetical protein